MLSKNMHEVRGSVSPRHTRFIHPIIRRAGEELFLKPPPPCQIVRLKHTSGVRADVDCYNSRMHACMYVSSRLHTCTAVSLYGTVLYVLFAVRGAFAFALQLQRIAFAVRRQKMIEKNAKVSRRLEVETVKGKQIPHHTRARARALSLSFSLLLSQQARGRQGLVAWSSLLAKVRREERSTHEVVVGRCPPARLSPPLPSPPLGQLPLSGFSVRLS